MKIELNGRDVALLALIVLCITLFQAKTRAEAKVQRMWDAWKRGLDGRENWATDVQ